MIDDEVANQSSPVFTFLGGNLALDFANTVAWHASTDPSDRITSYSDLVTWGTQAGMLSELQAAYLEQAQAVRLEEAALALRTAGELREAIYELVTARIAGRQPVAAGLGVLNRVLREGLLRLRVAPTDSTFALQWASDDLLERPLWPVAWAAAQLLVSPDLPRVKQCASADGCGWLFVDRSKNQSRRWCDMRACGNTAKARRLRDRRRLEARRK